MKLRLAVIALIALLALAFAIFKIKKSNDYFEPAHIEVGNGQNF